MHIGWLDVEPTPLKCIEDIYLRDEVPPYLWYLDKLHA